MPRSARYSRPRFVVCRCLLESLIQAHRTIRVFEHRAQPVLSPLQFVARLARSGGVALILVCVTLLLGMVGYHLLEGLTWIDAFLNASMLLGGMLQAA